MPAALAGEDRFAARRSSTRAPETLSLLFVLPVLLHLEPDSEVGRDFKSEGISEVLCIVLVRLPCKSILMLPAEIHMPTSEKDRAASSPF